MYWNDSGPYCVPICTVTFWCGSSIYIFIYILAFLTKVETYLLYHHFYHDEYTVYYFALMIQWPDDVWQILIATYFQLSYGIPNVIGIIVETHIQLIAPTTGNQDYINRKGYPSVLLQIHLVLSNYTISMSLLQISFQPTIFKR